MRLIHEVLSLVSGGLQAGSLTFNFEPFLDSILAEDLGSAGKRLVLIVKIQFFLGKIDVGL